MGRCWAAGTEHPLHFKLSTKIISTPCNKEKHDVSKCPFSVKLSLKLELEKDKDEGRQDERRVLMSFTERGVSRDLCYF